MEQGGNRGGGVSSLAQALAELADLLLLGAGLGGEGAHAVDHPVDQTCKDAGGMGRVWCEIEVQVHIFLIHAAADAWAFDGQCQIQKGHRLTQWSGGPLEGTIAVHHGGELGPPDACAGSWRDPDPKHIIDVALVVKEFVKLC